MAQTSQGAAKVAAARIGIELVVYQQKILAEKWCTKGKHWQPRGNFAKDVSRGDGLATKCQACTRVANPYASLRGRVSTFKGKAHTQEAKARMSVAKAGKPSPLKGRKLSAEIRARISVNTKANTKRGVEHYAYSHGQHQRNLDARRTTEYAEWRMAVFTRDNFTCQHCQDNQGGNLQAHHLKPFADFPELRFEVSNGQTLCQNCHEKVHLKPIPVARVRRKKHAPPAE